MRANRAFFLVLAGRGAIGMAIHRALG